MDVHRCAEGGQERHEVSAVEAARRLLVVVQLCSSVSYSVPLLYTRRRRPAAPNLRVSHAPCSTVPMATTVEECKEICELVERTGLKYMMAEVRFDDTNKE